MFTIETPGKIDENGKLILFQQDWFKEQLRENRSHDVDVVIMPRSNNISSQQRRYFFGVIARIFHANFLALGTQCTFGNVVNWIKDTWLHRDEFNPITGRLVKTLISLSNSSKALSKEEFQDKKEQIQQYAIEKMNLEVPDPDPNWKMYRVEKQKI